MKRRLQICHVTTAGGWGRIQLGGAERGVSDLLRHLDPERFELTLVCPEAVRGVYEDAVTDIVTLAPRGRFDPRYANQLRTLFRNREFDVVHLHLLSPIVHGRVAARLAGVPFVVTDLHNSLLSLSRMASGTVERTRYASYRAIDRFGANRLTSASVAISEGVARDMRSQGVNPDRIRVIENWVDPKQFAWKNSEERRACKAALGLDEALTAAVIGRLEPEKRFELVIEAIAKLPEWRLVVCGTGSRENELRALARDLAADERVRFLGRREDVDRVMGAAQVVCVPSVVDGFGRVAVEALSVGTPVLAHALDALPDVLGRLPGVEWAEATVSGWVHALTHAKTWQVNSAKLSEAALTRYGLDRAVRAYADLYEEAR